jgi:hypothetical protein
MLGSIGALCVAGFAADAASHYTFSRAGNVPGAFLTVPIAASLTQIVGYYEASGVLGGYVQTGTQFITPVPQTAFASYLSGINRHGVAVGGFCTYGCPPLAAEHGYTYNFGTGAIRTIDFPGTADGTVAYGINNLGDVVGGYCPGATGCPQSLGSAATHGFLRSKHKFTTLDHPGRQVIGTSCLAINDAGTIVGFYGTGNAVFGFMYQSGKYSALNFPGAIYTMPVSINNSGVIAGYFQDSNYVIHGFTYQNGAFTQMDLPPQKALSTAVDGINDAGVLVGIYAPTKGMGPFRNFKAVPQNADYTDHSLVGPAN